MAVFGRDGLLRSVLAVCRMMKCHAREMWRCTHCYDGLPRRGYPSSGFGISRDGGGWINRRLIRHGDLWVWWVFAFGFGGLTDDEMPRAGDAALRTLL
jgi:hypothetical protein